LASDDAFDFRIHGVNFNDQISTALRRGIPPPTINTPEVSVFEVLRN
jgi:hypothetical protein